MIYYVDIDETICYYKKGEREYPKAMPDYSRIEKINKLYDEGHYIIYMTARAMGRNKHKSHEEAAKVAHELLFPLTKSKLKMWGCKYHELIMGKPHADLFIDDKGISDEDFFRKICS